MREAVIVEAVRTPIARGKPMVGELSGFHAVELLGLSLAWTCCLAVAAMATVVRNINSDGGGDFIIDNFIVFFFSPSSSSGKQV